VSDYASVKSFVETFIAEWTSMDVLVNNAGLGFFEPLVQGNIEQWHEMIDTNVKGVLNCLHAALPHLIASTGQIINLGSLASHHVFPNSGVYCASKHALFAISESIRTELPDKVRVTTISPGSVNTPFIDKTTNEEMLRQYKDYFAAGLAVGVIADQIVHAVSMPMGTNISEIVIRPSRAIR
jgi:NADP-dependent 3-hydroxy acid dehydrogenase YdfG